MSVIKIRSFVTAMGRLPWRATATLFWRTLSGVWRVAVRRPAIAASFLAFAVWSACGQLAYGQLLSYKDVLARARPSSAERFTYGADKNQFADLGIPTGPGPYPVVVLIHGGCWIAALPGLELLNPIADDLRNRKYAVWNIEYRRADQPGGGYPGTFSDVGLALDKLRTIAGERRLNLASIVVIGHSAGGHLALWAAGRSQLPKSSSLYSANPLPIAQVVSLGGIGDLKLFQPFAEPVCGSDVVAKLVGEKTADRPDVFSDTSPAEFLPIRVRQTMVHGVFDDAVSPYFGLAYQTLAKRRGDSVDLIIIDGAGHFEVIAPWTPAWKKVLAVLRPSWSSP